MCQWVPLYLGLAVPAFGLFLFVLDVLLCVRVCVCVYACACVRVCVCVCVDFFSAFIL